MTLRHLFLDASNNLRAGWKFLAYVAIFLAVWVCTGIFLSLLAVMVNLPAENDLLVLALNAIALFVPAATALFIMAHFVDHAPVSTFGTALHSLWRRDFLAGAAIASGMLLVVLVGSYLLGSANISWTASRYSLLIILAAIVILIVSAANEELVFRGYPLQALVKGLGPWPATLIMSGIFGLIHGKNPDSTAIGVLNTILAGVLLSVAYLKTRSLWLPYAIHVIWNLGLGPILGVPVSGIDLPSLWTTRVEGPPHVLGGAYGPEGGLIGTMIFAGALIGIGFFWPPNRTTHD